jgi:hypothetical protein
MLDAGCWMLDAGCWMLDAGCWDNMSIYLIKENHFPFSILNLSFVIEESRIINDK